MKYSLASTLKVTAQNKSFPKGAKSIKDRAAAEDTFKQTKKKLDVKLKTEYCENIRVVLSRPYRPVVCSSVHTYEPWQRRFPTHSTGLVAHQHGSMDIRAANIHVLHIRG